MKRKLVIFDFDGTLADSFPAFIRGLRDACREFGLLEVRDEEFETLRRMGAREVIRHLRIPFWKVPRIGRYVHAAMTGTPGGTPLFAGVDEMLTELNGAGIPIAVVTSNSEENVRATLGPELSSLIYAFGCGASLFGKAARFRHVLRVLKIDPSDALSVGDEIRDIEASTKVRIPFGAVSWGYTHPEALMARGAQHLFCTHADIVRHVLGQSTAITASRSQP